MSSIDPTSSGSSSSGTTGVTGATGTTGATGATGSTGPVDTISSSTANSNPGSPLLFKTSSSATPWLDPPSSNMSLIQYAGLVGTARINLTSQSQYSDALGFTVTSDMWKNAISIAELIRSYYQNVVAIHNSLGILSVTQQSQASAVTPSINAYNSQNNFTADKNATNTMNTAITNYNNGTITATQFNAAVTTYNNYANTHNMKPYVSNYNFQAQQYNAQVAAFNAQVDATNTLNAQSGLPPIPEETPLPSGTLPTVSAAPPATPPIALLDTPPSSIPHADAQIEAQSLDTLINNSGFNDYCDNLLKSIGETNDKLFKAETYRDLNVFTHRDILDPRNPPYETQAFIQKNNEGSAPTQSGGAAASSGGYSSLSAGLDGNALPRILGLNNFRGSLADAKAPLDLKDFMALSNLVIGARAGLLSAAPGVLSVGDSSLNGLSAGNQPINVLVSLGFANVIRGLINSQQLSGIVGNLLSSNGVSEQDLEVLTKSVTAGFQLALIQQSIFQVANALGLPGSVAQIIGNFNGIPELNVVAASATTPTVNDVLGNEFQTTFLKNNLITQLTIKAQQQPLVLNLPAAPVEDQVDASQIAVSQAATQDQIAQLVNTAVDTTVAQGSYTSADAFADALQAQLISQGLDADNATASSIQASLLLRDEINSSSLDESVTDEQIGESIQNSDLATQASIDDSVQNSNVLEDAQTARDIRDGLLAQLTIQGSVFSDALRQANELTETITGARLAQEIAADTLNQSALQKSISDNLARTGGDPSLAASITQGLLESNFNNSAQARDILLQQLQAAGVNSAQANEVAEQAVLVNNNADPFLTVGATNILTPAEIAVRLEAETYNILKGSFDNATATSVAQQLAAAVVGSPTNQDVAHDDITRPVSLFNLANDQIAALKETNDDQIISDMKDSFRETMRPNDDLFYITNWQNTPGTELIEAMSLTGAKKGKHPSNFQNTVDIPA